MLMLDILVKLCVGTGMSWAQDFGINYDSLSFSLTVHAMANGIKTEVRPATNLVLVWSSSLSEACPTLRCDALLKSPTPWRTGKFSLVGRVVFDSIFLLSFSAYFTFSFCIFQELHTFSLPRVCSEICATWAIKNPARFSSLFQDDILQHDIQSVPETDIRERFSPNRGQTFCWYYSMCLHSFFSWTC